MEICKRLFDTGWVSSVGAYVDQFEKMSAEFTGTKYAVATSSDTTALHICLVMTGVNADDYVIISIFSALQNDEFKTRKFEIDYV